jgi:mono/diheme cytochrome c family protein
VPLLVFVLGLPLPAWPAALFAQPEPAKPRQRTTDVTITERDADGQASRTTLQPRCARCHDQDGTGRSGREHLSEIPDFSDHKWHLSRTDAQLLVSILDGKGSHMPSYRGKLSEKEARDMVVQVRDLDPAPGIRQVADSPDRFERRFKELEEELQELKRRFRELSEPPRKP